jgi:succinate-acetate transporter protein
VNEPAAPIPATGIADPAPLGLAAFALTTFLLSVVNSGWTGGSSGAGTGLEWVGAAFFYGGLAQLLAGMWEFRNRNTFGATAFSTYGAFWLSLAFYILFLSGRATHPSQTEEDLYYFLLAFFFFNTYMMLWSTRVSVAVFAVFFTLEVTELLLWIGFKASSATVVHIGGYIGILTAVTAWYASAAGVINSLSRRPVLPVGAPPWRA